MTEELREMRDEMRENHKSVSASLTEIQRDLNRLSTQIALQEAELKRLDKIVSNMTGGLAKVLWAILSVIIGAVMMWIIGGGLDGKG